MKSNNIQRLQWKNRFKGINKVCMIVLAVLMYLLTVFLGLYQELNIYTIESNFGYTKYAASIIKDTNAVAEEVLSDVSHVNIKAPMGKGNFVAIFNEAGSDVVSEVWVVEELSLLDSLNIVLPFTLLDLATFITTLGLIKKYFNKCKKRICVLSVYQIVFLMFAWIVNSYAWTIMFGSAFMYVSGGYTLIRLLILSFMLAKYDEFFES